VDGDDFPDVVIGDDVYRIAIALPLKVYGRITMWSLAPEGVTTYGEGCTGPAGKVPRIGCRGSAVHGKGVPIHLSKATPGADAFLAIGTSDSSWAGFTLPFDLAALGMPGCALWTSVDTLVHRVTQALPPAPGRATVEVSIPDDLNLIGMAFHAQWLVAPGAGAPASATRALRLRIL
jgi:hypothetical protein